MMKMKPMTSLEDFDATSVKEPSVTSKGIAINPKLTVFMQNNVKQQPKTMKNIRPSSSHNIPIPVVCRNPGFASTTYIPHAPNQPQLYRQVTVRYS